MQYILSQEEKDNLVPKRDFLLEKEKVQMLANAYRDSSACRNLDGDDVCDGCPIGSLDNKLSQHASVCMYQQYSK